MSSLLDGGGKNTPCADIHLARLSFLWPAETSVCDIIGHWPPQFCWLNIAEDEVVRYRPVSTCLKDTLLPRNQTESEPSHCNYNQNKLVQIINITVHKMQAAVHILTSQLSPVSPFPNSSPNAETSWFPDSGALNKCECRFFLVSTCSNRMTSPQPMGLPITHCSALNPSFNNQREPKIYNRFSNSHNKI